MCTCGKANLLLHPAEHHKWTARGRGALVVRGASLNLTVQARIGPDGLPTLVHMPHLALGTPSAAVVVTNGWLTPA